MGVNCFLGETLRGCESTFERRSSLIKLLWLSKKFATRGLGNFGESGHGLAWGRASLQQWLPREASVATFAVDLWKVGASLMGSTTRAWRAVGKSDSK